MIVEALLLVTSLPETPIQPPEPPAIVETVPELTLEEKIKTNFYKCNTDIEWIWAQDATCHPKQSNTQPEPQKASEGAQNSSQAPSGWYPYGQCTFYIWTKRPVGKWNNASQWRSQAQRDGWTVSKTPIVGAIAWESNHVALVESIDGDKVTVSEMNYKGLGVVSKRTVAISNFSYIY